MAVDTKVTERVITIDAPPETVFSPPDGTGAVRSLERQRGLPQDAIASHTEGWDYFLPPLEDVAEGRPAREAPQHTDVTTEPQPS